MKNSLHTKKNVCKRGSDTGEKSNRTTVENVKKIIRE